MKDQPACCKSSWLLPRDENKYQKNCFLAKSNRKEKEHEDNW